jgi:uncharacterized membrane protein YjjP (DUF1212 family)
MNAGMGPKSPRPPDTDEVLLLAADSARIVLESGGETYRAEETAGAFASSLGGVEVECFAMPTGIVMSFVGPDGRIHSIMRRVGARSLNFGRIALIETLSRDLYSGRLDYEGAAAALDGIERLAERPLAISLLAAAAGTGFFTLFFGGAWNDALVAAIIGALLSRMVRYLARRRISDFFTNLVGGAFIVLVTLAAARFGIASSADLTIIGAAMYLVPGVAITNAIRDTISGDLVAGVARSADAFMAAAGISIGAGSAFELWRLLGGGAA